MQSKCQVLRTHTTTFRNIFLPKLAILTLFGIRFLSNVIILRFTYIYTNQLSQNTTFMEWCSNLSFQHFINASTIKTKDLAIRWLSSTVHANIMINLLSFQ